MDVRTDLRKLRKSLGRFVVDRSSLWLGLSAGVCALYSTSLRLLAFDGAVAVLSTLVAGLLAFLLALLFRTKGWVGVLISSVLFILAAFYSARERADLDATPAGYGEISGYGNEAVLAVALLFLMLSFYRMSPYPFLAIAAGVGWLFWTLLGSWIYGVSGFIASVLVLGLMNYVIQLFIDHQHEIAAIPRRWLLGLNVVEVGQTLYIWLFAVIFIMSGLAINQLAQQSLHLAIYRAGAIVREPHGPGKDMDRSIERDLLYTIERARFEDVRAYRRTMVRTRSFGDEAWKEFPFQTEIFIESQRPGDLDANEACKNAQTRVLGKSITFRTMCRDMVNGVNGLIQSSFETTKLKLVTLAETKTAASEHAKNKTIDDAEREGIAAINEGYRGFRQSIVALFILLWSYVLVGYLALLCGLVASLQLVVGRVLFHDSVISSRNSQIGGGTPQRFCLDTEAKGNSARKLDFSKAHEVTLASMATDDFAPEYWYLSAGTARKGVGTHMFLWIPQFWRCFFQRLIARRLLMTRVAMPRKARAARGATDARISVSGDCLLVPIRIQDKQSVVFRMRDLVAFSNAVTFKSIYTTYVGAHLLGLGAFYSVAEGRGIIVLRSDGLQLAGSARGTSVPSVNLLAWDRRSQFALAQSLGIFGVWFNDPNIVTRSVRHSALIDEGSASRFPLASRFWRLLRYLFVPI
jgi:hypothetical protein